MLSGKITNPTINSNKEKIDKLLQDINIQTIRLNNYKSTKKNSYESIIPLKIYQTWHTKNLPPLMQQAVNLIKQQHPNFEHFLFDDNDCREFIKNNFDASILKAFDSLIPGAYKADLWRYCVLYINGGIYLDIKYACINTFRLIELTEKEHYVIDIDGSSIYNALLACLPKNQILLKCINQIVINVNNKFYGSSCLDPTGPGLLSKFFFKLEKIGFELSHIMNHRNNSKFILYKNISILKMYENYYYEHNRFKKVDHYSELWTRRRIYK